MTEASQATLAAATVPNGSGAPGISLNRPVPSVAIPEAVMPPEETCRLLQLYASRSLYSDSAEWVIKDNPYRRPIDRKLVQDTDFSKPLVKADALGSSALAAHRMLLNIYETDLIFLPDNNFAAKKSDFSSYYSNENKLLGEMSRPMLERHVFGFLNDEIQITGKWSIEALQSYLQSVVSKHEASELEICDAIVSSADPQRACRALLIQLAGDFLCEASASARNILGKYGQIQSELFKIVIDDYGYGVHAAKHSTLFEKTLSTAGLVSDLHAYWHFYLSSSLSLNNYYHYVSRDHSKYFQALGAIAVAESMFSHSCRKISEMIRTVFGKTVDTYYFDEHYHIDAHHGRMALEQVVAPAVAKYGNAVIPDIVRGMEELQLLTSLADEDLMAQIAFADGAETLKSQGMQLQRQIVEGTLELPKTTQTESRSQSFVTRVCDQAQLYIVESGALDVVIGHDQSVRLESGEATIIPRQRLYGAAVDSEECVYHVYEAEDTQSCLS